MSSTKVVFSCRSEKQNKMAALVADWLTHFPLLLWHHCIEFNETWQYARSQLPLPSLCFSSWSEKQDGCPGPDWLRHFWLLLWNCWRESIKTWQEVKSQCPLPSLCFSNKMTALASDWLRHFRLLLWHRWTEFKNLTKLDRKQYLDVLYQVKFCVLAHPSRRPKWAIVIAHRLSSVRLSVNFSHFWLLWNHWTEFNKTWQEARSQCPLPSLCFSGQSEKQDDGPGLWLAETFSTSPLKPLKGIQWNMTGSKITMSSTKFVFFGPIGKTSWPPWPLIGWDIFDFSSETAE